MAKHVFSNDELAFLAAIQAEPRDDTPRLAYADWLEERGDPLGEFIRLQCEAARQSGDTPEFKYTPRERLFISKHRNKWLGKRPRRGIYLGDGLEFAGFHRGLPSVTLFIAVDDECLDLNMQRACEVLDKVPHYQLHIVYITRPNTAGSTASVLGHDLFRRAQRIHVRADEIIGVVEGQRHVRESPVPEDTIRTVINIFRDRKMLYISFGEITATSKSLLRVELSPYVPTILWPTPTRAMECL